MMPWGKADGSQRLYDDSPAKDEIFRVAWQVAAKIETGQRVVTAADREALRKALVRHPEHTGVGKGIEWDGL